jgi:anti-anti-sigma factor
MELRVRKSGESYIVDVNGEVDLYNAYKLKELALKMLDKGVGRFVINLEDVDYIDSSGVGALIYICSTISKLGRKLVIANIHGSVRKVIELSKLTDFFPMEASIEEALTRLKA